MSGPPPSDWRVTIWQDEEDQRGGTFSVAIERRTTRGFEARWQPVEHRTVHSHDIAWQFAADTLQSEGVLS